MITEYYNIHNIIKIEINKESKGLYADLNPEYEYFKLEKIHKPDIIVNVGQFQPDISNTSIVDVNYKIKNDYVFYKNKDYTVEITGLENFTPAVINIDPTPKGKRKLWPILAGQNIFLRPLLEILAVRRGYVILHSAGISDKNNGFLFAGRGGSGKTSLIMEAIRNGFYLMSEERSLIGKGKLFPYLLNIRLIDFWINSMKDEYSRLKLYKYKAFKAITSKKEVSLKIGSKVNGKSIYLIKRNNSNSKSKISTIKASQISQSLLYNNIIDWEYGYMPFLTGISNFFFNRLMYSYLYINTNSKLLDHWPNFRKNIEMSLL